MRRVAAIVIAILAMAGFVLPFFAVTFRGTAVIHFTGLELLQGTTFHRPLSYGAESVLPPPLQPISWAWLAFGALLVAGIALSRGGRWGNLAGRIAGIAAILASAMLRANGKDAIGAIVPPPLELTPSPALWIPFAGAVLLWLLSVLRGRAGFGATKT